MTIPKVTVPAPTAQDSKPLQPVVTKARPSSEAKKTTTEAPAAVASAPPPPAVQQVKPVPPVEEIKPVKQELKTAADETTVSLPEKDTPVETRSSEREKEPVIKVKQVEPETEIAKEVVSLSKPKMEMQKEKPISVSEAKAPPTQENVQAALAKVEPTGSGESSRPEVVMRKKAPISNGSVQKHLSQNFGLEEDENGAESRPLIRSATWDPRRRTIHGVPCSGKNYDELLEKVHQEEQKRKAAYNVAKTSVIDSSTKKYLGSGAYATLPRRSAALSLRGNDLAYSARTNDPAYPGLNPLSKTMSTSSFNRDQKLKDEATDIRLSAELASKKALEVTGSGPASSSRLRIREVLERQRLHSLDRSATQTVDTVESLPFGSGYNSRLWVFR